MYYLRTHVFSKQEKEFVETAMAFACDINEFRITASTAASPRAVLTSRSILSTTKRNERRKLLLSPTARKTKLSSKLWSRKRRRKFVTFNDNCCSEKLLYKLQFQQYKRFIRSRNATAVPWINESIKERQSTRDIVPGDRMWIVVDRCSKQNTSSTLSANGLCPSSACFDSRSRTTSYCMPSLEMERSRRSQRNQASTEVPQRKRPHLCLLQSRSLESTLSTR